LEILRETELEKRGQEGVAGLLSRAAKGAVGFGKTVGKATIEGAKKSGDVLRDAGHPLLGTAVQYAPHVAGTVGAVKGYDALKKKYQMHQYRKALKAQQQQGY
jgi:hypothetical protein